MTTKLGLGSDLRRLLVNLDGDVQSVYDSAEIPFRPRYFPFAQALLEQSPRSVNELAELAELSQPAATQTLRMMVQDGFVTMKPEQQDRRRRLVTLTSAGKECCGKLSRYWAAIGRAASALDEEAGTSLAQALDMTLGALDRQSFLSRIEDELEQ